MTYTVWYKSKVGDNLFVSGVTLAQANSIIEELDWLGIPDAWSEED